MRSSYCRRIFPALITLLLLMVPECARATQMHPADEGYVVHQIGHLFFLFSMGIFVYWLRAMGLTKVIGWRLIQYSAIFFVLWNIDAMVVHFMDHSIEGIFETVRTGIWSQWICAIDDNNMLTLLYYLGRMDHFFCVPAIILLYYGLRDLLDQPASAESEERGGL